MSIMLVSRLKGLAGARIDARLVIGRYRIVLWRADQVRRVNEAVINTNLEARRRDTDDLSPRLQEYRRRLSVRSGALWAAAVARAPIDPGTNCVRKGGHQAGIRKG